MSLASVRAFLAEHAPEIAIEEIPAGTATVAMAAAGFGVDPARIAKTLALTVNGGPLLVVTSGDARLSNQKAKTVFGGRARMMSRAEVETVTGHPVGGVCPFGLARALPVYCDISLRVFDQVFIAAGSPHSALRINPLRLAQLIRGDWIDVCQSVSERKEPAPPQL